MEQLAMLEVVDATVVFEIIKSIIKNAGYEPDVLVAKEDGCEVNLISLVHLKGKGEHSIKIIEKPMCNIAIKPKGCYLQMKYHFLSKIKANNIQFTTIPSQEGSYVRLPFEHADDLYRMRVLLLDAFESAYDENAGASYGCCHRFQNCSDAKKCIHPNRIFSLGCMYRKNLEAGRIFYGFNRNI